MRRYSRKPVLAAPLLLLPALTLAADAGQKGTEKLRGFGLAESGPSTPGIGKILLVFLLMCAFAWGATWLLRRYGAKLPGRMLPGAGAGAGATPIRQLSRSTLPGGIACHVVEAQGREVLITVTRHGVTSLVLGDVTPPKSPI
jgi:hypothetical protein